MFRLRVECVPENFFDENLMTASCDDNPNQDA
jgi:hypothetical protein